MPLIPWTCAHGDAPTVIVKCGDVTDIASADSNVCFVDGGGVIRSFGIAMWVTKRVIFSAGVTIKHSPHLSLLPWRDREIKCLSFGSYVCDGDGNWAETSFVSTGPDNIEERLDRLERDMNHLIERKP